MSKMDTTRYYICWECLALLRRLGSFRQQVCDAQQQLIELLDDKYDTNRNIECLSKLSYNYKRSFDKEIIYSDALNKDGTKENEPSIDIKSDDKEPDIKTETEHEEIDQDFNETPFTEVHYIEDIKEENENTVNDFLMKREVEIKDGGEDSCSVNTDNTEEEAEEDKPKKKVLKRKISDTVKRKLKDGAKVKKNNVKRVQEDFDERNKNVSKQVSALCSVNIDNTEEEAEEVKPKRKVLKRKISDTAKRKLKDGAQVKENNVKRVQEDFDDRNKNVSKQVLKVPQVPKTRRPRKVQNKPEEDPNYPCSDCGQVFTTYTIRYEHIMKCHKEGYQCSTCGKKFHIKKSFLKHEQVHIAKTLPPEKCQICGAMVRCDLVKEHARRHASKDTATYECVQCDKQFANRNSYKKHMTEAKAHLPCLEKKFECETCHKSFPTLLLYNCHMRYTKRHAVRAEVYRYKCSMCEKSYRNPAALRDHVNYVHMGKTQHKCTVCNKALASPQCVARHMKLFHGGYKYPKNKLCVTCGKAFASKKELREHEFVHTGERPLKCDVCGDTFRQSGALYTHKRRVHKVPQRPSVALVTEPDEAVERLILNCELTESELVIKRANKD